MTLLDRILPAGAMRKAFRVALSWTAPVGVLLSTAILGIGIDLRDNPQTVVASAGVLVALFAFVFNAQRARDQSREQHTIKILFDTRLSAEFRRLLEERRAAYPEFRRIDPAVFASHLALDPGDAEVARLRHGAEAVRSLLNYYEFLALGIRRGDLDGALLHGTIRGIMCNLVVDCIDVIDAQRAGNPAVLEHLVALYLRWKRPDDPPPATPPEPRA